MRITKEQLKQIIKEELAVALQESDDDHEFPSSVMVGENKQEEEAFFVALYNLISNNDEYHEAYEAIEDGLHAGYVEDITISDTPEQAAGAFLEHLRDGDLYQ